MDFGQKEKEMNEYVWQKCTIQIRNKESLYAC